MKLKFPKIPDTLIIALLLPLAMGLFSSLFTPNVTQTYARLLKPEFSPPAAVFPLVWTIIYLLMGVSTYLIYTTDHPCRIKALTIYLVQLGMNFLWSIFFFTLHWYLFAFIWLLLLIAVLCIMIWMFWKIKPIAAYLQIPYLIWCLFAAVLNLCIYIMN